MNQQPQIIINTGTPQTAATSDEANAPAVEMKRFKITATIPTVQYGNIQPEYEIEAPTFDEAHKIALPYIEKLWAKYCAKGSELKVKSIEEQSDKKLEKMTSSMTPGMAYFHEGSHKYFNKDGDVFTSGSKFCKQFMKPFDKDNILPAMEKKHGIDAAEIEKLWSLKGKTSTDLGSAIHGALEMYGRYKDMGEKLGAGKKPVVNTALHDHPLLQPIVESFYKGREKEVALYEEFIVDEDRMLCGQLDRVLIVNQEKKICRVQDFKTNTDINKANSPKYLLRPFENMLNTPLEGYWLQLSFYANILQKHGWQVDGLDIFAFNGQWETYQHEVINLEEVI